MIEPIIQFVDVHKSFESTNGAVQKVLRGIDFSIRPGMTTVIGGASCQGKSVAIKLILGLMKPDSGKILVEGRDITVMGTRELNEIRSNFGVVFQGVAPFDSMTVFENVAFAEFLAFRSPQNKLLFLQPTKRFSGEKKQKKTLRQQKNNF